MGEEAHGNRRDKKKGFSVKVGWSSKGLSIWTRLQVKKSRGQMHVAIPTLLGQLFANNPPPQWTNSVSE